MIHASAIRVGQHDLDANSAWLLPSCLGMRLLTRSVPYRRLRRSPAASGASEADRALCLVCGGGWCDLVPGLPGCSARCPPELCDDRGVPSGLWVFDALRRTAHNHRLYWRRRGCLETTSRGTIGVIRSLIPPR